MIKFPRFLLAIIAMVAVSPSISFAAAAVGADAGEDLIAVSPTRKALLADPIFEHFKRMGRDLVREHDYTPKGVIEAVDALPMADWKDLWVVQDLLNYCIHFGSDQQQAVGAHVAVKVERLKAHADKNMQSMAMYCWARSRLHALQTGQRDMALEVLTEAFGADMSEYLKVKLASYWFVLSKNFQEDLDGEYPNLKECMLGYTMLDPSVSDLFRPHFLCSKARKTRFGDTSKAVEERAKIAHEAVVGTKADPYYHTKAQMLEAYGGFKEILLFQEGGRGASFMLHVCNV